MPYLTFSRPCRVSLHSLFLAFLCGFAGACAPGELLLQDSACVECPYGLACDGGAEAFPCTWPAVVNSSAGVCVCAPGYVFPNVTVFPNGTNCKFPCPANASCVALPTAMRALTEQNWSCAVCGAGYGHADPDNNNWPQTTWTCPNLVDRHWTLVPILAQEACCSVRGSCSDRNYVCDNCYSDVRQVMCSEGFTRGGEQGGWPTCVECPDKNIVAECAAGTYQQRCSLDCARCEYPVLGPYQEYGAGARKYAACEWQWPYEGASLTEPCALYATPLYNMGACEVRCTAGAFFDGTRCAPCATRCAPGTQPDPACSVARDLVATTGACVACSDAVPANATRTRNCDWTCVAGLYWNGTACTACPVGGTSCDGGSLFMGCSGLSRGSCVPCSQTCVPGRTYLYVGVEAAACECRACATGAPGLVRVSTCTNLSNTVYRPCATCVEGWASAACSELVDTVCSPCSYVPPGMLTLVACNATHDVVQGPCPPTFACDGSATLSHCDPPSVLDPDRGLCVCSSGFVGTPADGCRVMTCPGGRYPTANGTCEPCVVDPDSAQAVVVPGVLGAGACRCPPGFYAEGQLKCWPCGTLDCDARTHVQSACRAPDGPRCECAPPWASVLLDNDTCAFACAEGHEAVGQGQQLAFAAPRLFCNATVVVLETQLMDQVPRMALAEPQAVLLPGNAIFLVESQQLVTPDSLQLQNGYYENVLEFTAIAPHPEPANLWISLTYHGTCWVDADLLQVPGVVCTTLILLDTRTQQQVYGWGSAAMSKMHAGYSQYGGIYAVASGADGHLLFLAQHDGTQAYVLSYDASTADDLQLLWQGYLPARISSLVVQGQRAFGWTQGSLLQWSPQWSLERTWPLSDVYGLYSVPPDRVAFGLDGWLDARNQLLQPSSSVAAAVAVSGSTRVVAYAGGRVTVEMGAAACTADSLCYGGECRPMPCVRSQPYGPHADRTGACLPGYATDLCTPCPVGSYCSGNGSVPCPSHSTTAAPGATALRDCVCLPGYYRYGISCLPCDAFSWCPGPLRLPCVGGGSTALAASSPLQCRCPARTYGLLCTACPPNALCTASPRTAASLVALEVRGLVNVSCLSSLGAPLYPGLEGVWYAVLLVASLTAVQATCPLNFTVLDSVQCSTGGCSSLLQTMTVCPKHMEWDGRVPQRCACAGGYYYDAPTDACLPCAPGTFRTSSQSESALCEACNATRRAPYAGMSACVCPEATDPSTGECVARRVGVDGLLHEATLWAPLTVVASVGALMCATYWGRRSAL